MAEPLIHIGYHKTATSWLQRRLFLPDCGYQQIANHREVWEKIISPLEHRFDTDAVGGFFRDRIKDCPDGVVPVISSEPLCGNPFYGANGRARNAQRLAALFPKARILITIRAQSSMLRSTYMQYLHRGGTETPLSFFTARSIPGYPRFDPEHFCYDALASLYLDLFEQVLVVPQEALIQSAADFSRAINVFAGAPPDACPTRVDSEVPSPSEAMAPVLRRMNHLRFGALNRNPFVYMFGPEGTSYRAMGRLGRSNFVKGLSFKPVSKVVKAQFADHYDASNQRLDQLGICPFPLKAYPGITSDQKPAQPDMVSAAE
ncbi:MAG: hypothetical protein AAFY03_02875 [Pseudomonadota bacterium]